MTQEATAFPSPLTQRVAAEIRAELGRHQMSQRQLAEKLVQALPKLKVMYISGFTDDESVRAGAFPPGARFLQKPFTLGALIGTVRETLDQ